MVPKALGGLLILGLLFAMSVGAETFYVDALDGVDTGSRDGLSSTQAFRTISYASDRASAGDTVVVLPGHYFDIFWRDSVYYLARGRAVIEQHDHRGSQLSLNNIVFEGFEFRVPGYSFNSGWVLNNITFRRCKFLGGSGLRAPMNNSRFERCLFAGLHNGIVINPGGNSNHNGNGNRIDRCTFVGMTGVAVSLTGSASMVTNSLFSGNNHAVSMIGGANSVQFSAFHDNGTDVSGGPYAIDDNYLSGFDGGSNKPPIDPNFLDPGRGLYFLQPLLADGVTPNPLVDGGSFVPEENRITHIGAFGVGVLADSDVLTSGANAFPNWTVAAGEPDSGASFEPITETPAASLPVEFDADGNLRLKEGATVATLRSNVMDLQPTVPLDGLEVVGVHYESFEDPHTVPRGQRRVIDHNRVDDGTGGVEPDRRRTIRMRGSSVSAADVLGQAFFEINGSERLPYHDVQYVQLEMVLRRNGI